MTTEWERLHAAMTQAEETLSRTIACHTHALRYFTRLNAEQLMRGAAREAFERYQADLREIVEAKRSLDEARTAFLDNARRDREARDRVERGVAL